MTSLPQGNCSECDALWRVYGQASAEYRRLVARAREFVIGAKHELREAIELADHRRMAARDAIYQHVAHPLHGTEPSPYSADRAGVE